MTTATELWLFAVAVGASALGGMLGMASGIFIVPVLTMFCQVDIRSAIGASIVSVIACSCSQCCSFSKGQDMRPRRIKLLVEKRALIEF